MTDREGTPRRASRRWLTEPMLHFFLIGALLFVLHRAFVGDDRTIVVTAAIRADVIRRFLDQNQREPRPQELARAILEWKREEALYREALRNGLDREDATVRTVLADKIRFLAALEAPKREPTEAELERFLEAHRSLYEEPLRYDYDYVTFAKAPGVEQELANYERALDAGQAAPTLGRPVAGGSLTLADLRERLGSAFADNLAVSPPGRWKRLEQASEWLLLRLNRTVGGLPSMGELHARLVADWSRRQEQEQVERALSKIVARYHFEERP